MVDERESPSAGWREVYREMDADTRIEEATARCPDCGRTSENVARDVYDCEEHGLFRASAAGGDASDAAAAASDASEPSSAGESSESAQSTADDAPPNVEKRNASNDDENDPPEADDEATRRARWSAGPV
ncbi:hypothetical protein [Halorussus ruber]|uniref:hypothetical protein n=1 Tax=Halorussus ruber TaxID=1126238 RepID=UPI001091BFFD|nr:hypothetical protein [Halorussus ruber]